jgi:hypothetical protein
VINRAIKGKRSMWTFITEYELLFKEEEEIQSERESFLSKNLDSQTDFRKKMDGLMFEYTNYEQAE